MPCTPITITPWLPLGSVLFEHGGLPWVLPYAVHLHLGQLPDTLGYLGHLSEPNTPTQTLLMLEVGVVGWVDLNILVTAQMQIPFSFFLIWSELGLGHGLGFVKI